MSSIVAHVDQDQVAQVAPQASPVLINAPVLAIVGCTGVGKSKLAIELAERFNGEVISADSMQIYNALPIATNRVTLEEQERAVHHLLAHVDPFDESYTVVRFRDEALAAIAQVHARGKLPVIVGGTNYYIEALLWKVLLDEVPGVEAGWRRMHDSAADLQKLLPNLDEESPAALYAELQRIDPVMASRLHPNSARKVRRSIEVFHQYGQKHSDILKSQHNVVQSLATGGVDALTASSSDGNAGGENEAAVRSDDGSDEDSDQQPAETAAAAVMPGSRPPPRFARTAMIWIDCEQSVLDERLDNRVVDMVSQGLMDELRGFFRAWHQRYPAPDGQAFAQMNFAKGILQAIGFKEFDDLFKSEWLQAASSSNSSSRSRSNPEQPPALAAADQADGTSRARRKGDSPDTWSANDGAPQIKRSRTLSGSRGASAVSSQQQQLDDALAEMKRATRKYSHKQISWITRRLLPYNWTSPFAAAPVQEASDLPPSNEAGRCWPESSEALKAAFRVYVVDSTDVSKWDETALQPASRIVEALLQPRAELPDPILASRRQHRLELAKTTIPSSPYQPVEMVKHVCKLCQRDLYGADAWKSHIESNAHRKRQRSQAKRAAYTEYLNTQKDPSKRLQMAAMVVDVVSPASSPPAPIQPPSQQQPHSQQQQQQQQPQ
ncbi:tRNA isopentenyltransferase 1 [Capsaspora owczarzaki ATCC 30864]|uniref:tRNA isopentenyltransferase 1 n=1 Tax=Capsaspora owczarzaki (strain ATCC 30864) TaxID=595528 RepID=A0A0D2X409_CAPO3|nr:tRNA isopentenyltransferase 1 [Capsaspora owczarzaki ATCC 30864]